MERPLFLPGVGYGIALDRLFTAKEVDDFIALYQDPNTTELQIHQFFSATPKFLYLLGAYNKVLSEVSFFGTAQNAEADRKCFRLDFLLQHYQNVWDVVEIKKATLGSGSLIVGSSVRPRFAYELQDAVAQVRVYLDHLAQREVQQQLERQGIFVRRPKAWIIAGRNENVSISEKRFLAENLPHTIDLLTYDDLAELSKQRAIIVTKSIQFPLLSALQHDAVIQRESEDPLQTRPPYEDAKEAITKLSTADLLRLQSYSRLATIATQSHGSGDDLLQEAILATLEGRRTWNTEVSLKDHLIGVMRSISSNWRKRPRGEDIDSYDFKSSEDREANLIASERLQRVQELLADDAAAQKVFTLMGLGYSAVEISMRLNMSRFEVNATARRIRRRIKSGEQSSRWT